jgi:hypothetical protein
MRRVNRVVKPSSINQSSPIIKTILLAGNHCFISAPSLLLHHESVRESLITLLNGSKQDQIDTVARMAQSMECSRVHNSTEKGVRFELTRLLLQQATIGRQPVYLFLEYLNHLLSSGTIDPGSVIDSVVKFSKVDNTQITVALLGN